MAGGETKNGSNSQAPFSGPVRLPITGELDLHTFAPAEAASAVEEYLHVCSEKGIREVKIIHGKGTGALRRTVEAVLSRHPLVASFGTDRGPSGWGATSVRLHGRTR